VAENSTLSDMERNEALMKEGLLQGKDCIEKIVSKNELQIFYQGRLP